MVRGIVTIVALVSGMLASCGGGGGGGGGPAFELEDVDGDGQIIIIAFGDSITKGTGDGATATTTPSDGGWPARLRPLVPAVVYNAGVPGERTRFGRPRLQRILADSASDYVIITEGVNDIEFGEQSLGVRNIEAMVGDVFADGSVPVLGTLTPTCCNHVRSASPGAVVAFNDEVRRIAAENGLILIDFWTAFVPPPATEFDPASGLIHVPEGLHPTPTGYDVMAATAADALLAGPVPPP